METQGGGLALNRRGHCDDPLGCLPVHSADQFSLGYASSGRSARRQAARCNLLQASARTNRPLPSMQKRTALVVDYFGVFANFEKALNFDENIREESLIDWDALRATVPGEVGRCMELFEGITITDTRECLLGALRRLSDPDAAKAFEHNFKSLERLWEAVAPDPFCIRIGTSTTGCAAFTLRAAGGSAAAGIPG
jgi:hypothetical protein